MRTRGWAGATPSSDEEAAARILSAAKIAIERDGDVNIADIARAVGVTRQTVYRYFPSADALLVAAAFDSASDFLDQLAAHLSGLTDPAGAVVEGVGPTKREQKPRLAKPKVRPAGNAAARKPKPKNKHPNRAGAPKRDGAPGGNRPPRSRSRNRRRGGGSSRG